MSIRRRGDQHGFDLLAIKNFSDVGYDLGAGRRRDPFGRLQVCVAHRHQLRSRVEGNVSRMNRTGLKPVPTTATFKHSFYPLGFDLSACLDRTPDSSGRIGPHCTLDEGYAAKPVQRIGET